MKLLLIDNRVLDYSIFVDSVKEDVEVIIYDYFEDTYQNIIDRKIKNEYESVGIVSQHYNGSFYQFLEKHTECTLENIEIYPESWYEFYDFLKSFNSGFIDVMSCSLFSIYEWKIAIENLYNRDNIKIRASSDTTGNLNVGGNWILESDNINVADIYFTHLIESYKYLLDYNSFNSNISVNDIILNPSSQILSWGNTGSGGDCVFKHSKKSKYIFSTKYAFASLNDDDTVYSWGDLGNGVFNDSVTYTIPGIKKIYTNDFAFTALKNDGTVFTWGYSTAGGQNSQVSSLTNVKDIYASQSSFAALTTTDKIYVWGNQYTGSSGAVGTSPGLITGITGVTGICSNKIAFAAINTTNNVYSWGTFKKPGPNIYFDISTSGATGVTGIAGITGAESTINGRTDIPIFTTVTDYNLVSDTFLGYNNFDIVSNYIFNPVTISTNVKTRQLHYNGIINGTIPQTNLTYVPPYYSTNDILLPTYKTIVEGISTFQNLSYYLHNNGCDNEKFLKLMNYIWHSKFMIPTDYAKNIDDTYLTGPSGTNTLTNVAGYTGYTGPNAIWGAIDGNLSNITTESPLPSNAVPYVNCYNKNMYMSPQGNFEACLCICQISMMFLINKVLNVSVNTGYNNVNSSANYAYSNGLNWINAMHNKMSSYSNGSFGTFNTGSVGGTYPGVTLPTNIIIPNNTWLFSKLSIILKYTLNNTYPSAIRNVEAIKDMRDILVSFYINNFIVLKNSSNQIVDGGFLLSEGKRGENLIHYQVYYMTMFWFIVIILDSQGFNFPFSQLYEKLKMIRDNFYNMAYGTEATVFATIKRYLNFFARYEYSSLKTYYDASLISDASLKATDFYKNVYDPVTSPNGKNQDMKICVAIHDYFYSKYVFNANGDNIRVFPEPEVPSLEPADFSVNIKNLVSALRLPSTKGGLSLKNSIGTDTTNSQIMINATNYWNKYKEVGPNYYDSMIRYKSDSSVFTETYFRNYYNV